MVSNSGIGLLSLCIVVCSLTGSYANLRYLRTVAFSAQRTVDVPTPPQEETIGGYVMVRKDDNNFDASSGVFTAPFRGVYAFAFTFHQDFRASRGPTDTTTVKLVKESVDGATKTDVVESESPLAPVGTPISVPGASVLLELDKGDKMFLATSDDVDAAVIKPITFSGYLLTRL